MNKILDGTKTYEFRRRLASEDVRYIYIYSTHPVMKVVARANLVNTLSATLELWRMTKSVAGIDYNEYRKYFKGCKIAYAYELGLMAHFDPPKDIEELGVSYPPQSFKYIDYKLDPTDQASE